MPRHQHNRLLPPWQVVEGHEPPARRSSRRCPMPMQVLAELRLGAEKSAKPIENRRLVDAFVEPYAVLWPDERIIEHYISIRCSLEAIGRNIGEADLWIAATARANGDVIVTNNTSEFGRVPGLAVEDWSA